MPDISCRTCGGSLVNHSLCTDCRKITRQICNICGSKTQEQIHFNCMSLEPSEMKKEIKNSVHYTQGKRVDINQKNLEKTPPLRNMLLVFGIVGFFVLGFATADYFDLFQNPTDEAQIMKTAISQHPLQNNDNLSPRSFDNCLAYGSGQSMTVTCPTEYGYVYKAILTAPEKLVAEFSNQVFSIRGISVIEYSDGSFILQYHKNLYTTGFFAN